MKHIPAWVLAGLVAGLALGCNTLGRQPKMAEAQVSPARLAVNQEAIITVKLTDREAVVDRVIATVKEDPRIKMRLNDSAQGADETAGDGVWTLAVRVPPLAPPGAWTLEITAYDTGGNVVLTKQADGTVAPLMSTAEVVITYPEGEPVPPTAPPAEAP